MRIRRHLIVSAMIASVGVVAGLYLAPHFDWPESGQSPARALGLIEVPRPGSINDESLIIKVKAQPACRPGDLDALTALTHEKTATRLIVTLESLGGTSGPLAMAAVNPNDIAAGATLTLTLQSRREGPLALFICTDNEPTGRCQGKGSDGAVGLLRRVYLGGDVMALATSAAPVTVAEPRDQVLTTQLVLALRHKLWLVPQTLISNDLLADLSALFASADPKASREALERNAALARTLMPFAARAIPGGVTLYLTKSDPAACAHVTPPATQAAPRGT